MKSIIGGALILVSSTLLGTVYTLECKKRLRLSEELIRFTDRLETEVCLRRRSLPQALITLESQFPAVFRHDEESTYDLTKPFAEEWSRRFEQASLPNKLESTMVELGKDLMNGQPPERSFALARENIALYTRELRQLIREKGRLYPMLGLCTGGFVVILFL